MPEKSLQQYEGVFWKMITAPEGVEQGLECYPDIHLDDWFLGDAKLAATRRLNIYANMYFWRIHDAIKEDYPSLCKVIGDQNWNNLMTDYLLKFPSQTPFLQYVGRNLPEFLKQDALLEEWPFLSDLARLEWERTMMFEAVESPYITIQDLQKMPPERWPQLRLRLVPAFKIITLAWAVTQTEIQMPERKETHIKIWRKDFAVYHKTLERTEKEALELLQLGKSFEWICERLQSAEEAADFLTNWVQSGLIKDVI